MERTKIIAEIANAHQGDANILMGLIKAAAAARADAVKFQWFKYNYLATKDYSFYEAYQQLFFPQAIWKKALKYAKELGMEIWVDVFDQWGLNLVYEFHSLIDGFKIPPTIIQSDDMIRELLTFNKSVLLGVGGWYDSEIDSFIDLVRQHKGTQKLTLIHGFQGYPTKTTDANLRRIQYLRNRYQLPVGFADHEDASKPLAQALPVYAIFAGAVLIEKHITLNRNKKGYDYFSALEPHEFEAMVNQLRIAEPALGSIQVNEAERGYLKDSLRVVAKTPLEPGEIVTLDKVAFKRCAAENALMPKALKEKLPLVVQSEKKILQDQPILMEQLEKPKITIGVICRLKSTRLAQKALLPIYGIPSVERCLINCLAVPEVDQVVLATSHLSEDDPLEEFTLGGKVKVLRGDPDNVAGRLLQAAQETNANIILRVTGDCPAVSPEILSLLIEAHLRTGSDLTLPRAEHAPGTAGDVYTVEALKRLLNQSKPLTHTEYLSFYYLNNPDIFSVHRLELPAELQYPQWRLTLDEQKDLEVFEHIYRDLDIQHRPLFFHQIRNYLLTHPHVTKINADVRLKWKVDKKLIKELLEATKLNHHSH
ncbi:N-acetylneuraminate synthase family protein [Alkaliphilus crotonatoxidans]